MPGLMTTILTTFFTIAAFAFSTCSKSDAEKSRPAKNLRDQPVVKEVKLVKLLKKIGAVAIRESVNLDPMERGAVSADVDSTVLKWHVEQNQYVKAGQLVATMDSTNFDLQIAQARSGIAGLEIQYSGAGNDYRRVKELQEKGAASTQQLEAIETQYNALEKQIEANRKSIALMVRMAGKTKVRAPFSGVITRKKLAIGGKTVTMMPDGAEVAYIEKIDKLKVSIWISEIYFGEIAAGDPISFEIPSLNRTVTSVIESKGLSINDARKFNLVSYLDNKDLSIPAGVSAVAVINTKERERIIVPPTALVQKGDGNAEVFGVVNGKVVSYKVVIGFPFEEGIEVMGEVPAAVVGDASLVNAGEAVFAKE